MDGKSWQDSKSINLKIPSSKMSMKCGKCNTSVYPVDPQICLNDTTYHKSCAKCEDCKCQVMPNTCIDNLDNQGAHRLHYQILQKVEIHFYVKFIIRKDLMCKVHMPEVKSSASKAIEDKWAILPVLQPHNRKPRQSQPQVLHYCFHKCF